MEFFVAKKLLNEIKDNNSDNFRLKKLPQEIIGFLVNLADNVDIFHKYINLTENKSFQEVKYLGGNSATIANLMGADFSERDMSSTVLVGANFDSAKLVNSNLSNSIFGMKIDSTANIKDNKYSSDLKYWDYALQKFFTNHIISDDKINQNELKEKLDEIISHYHGDMDNKQRKMFKNKIHEMGNKQRMSGKDILDIRDMLYNYSRKMDVSIKNPHTLNENKLREHSVSTTFVKANLQKANLNNCDLREVDLRDVNLRGASLVGSKLSGKNLSHTDLRDTDLREADLRNTDLREANLSGAILIRAKLNSANLSNANLMEVDLREANLIGSRLIGANLSKANLKGAIR